MPATMTGTGATESGTRGWRSWLWRA